MDRGIPTGQLAIDCRRQLERMSGGNIVGLLSEMLTPVEVEALKAKVKTEVKEEEEEEEEWENLDERMDQLMDLGHSILPKEENDDIFNATTQAVTDTNEVEDTSQSEGLDLHFTQPPDDEQDDNYQNDAEGPSIVDSNDVTENDDYETDIENDPDCSTQPLITQLDDSFSTPSSKRTKNGDDKAPVPKKMKNISLEESREISESQSCSRNLFRDSDDDASDRMSPSILNGEIINSSDSSQTEQRIGTQEIDSDDNLSQQGLKVKPASNLDTSQNCSRIPVRDSDDDASDRLSPSIINGEIINSSDSSQNEQRSETQEIDSDDNLSQQSLKVKPASNLDTSQICSRILVRDSDYEVCDRLSPSIVNGEIINSSESSQNKQRSETQEIKCDDILFQQALNANPTSNMDTTQSLVDSDDSQLTGSMREDRRKVRVMWSVTKKVQTSWFESKHQNEDQDKILPVNVEEKIPDENLTSPDHPSSPVFKTNPSNIFQSQNGHVTASSCAASQEGLSHNETSPETHPEPLVILEKNTPIASTSKTAKTSKNANLEKTPSTLQSANDLVTNTSTRSTVSNASQVSASSIEFLGESLLDQSLPIPSVFADSSQDLDNSDNDSCDDDSFFLDSIRTLTENEDQSVTIKFKREKIPSMVLRSTSPTSGSSCSSCEFSLHRDKKPCKFDFKCQKNRFALCHFCAEILVKESELVHSASPLWELAMKGITTGSLNIFFFKN